MIYLTIALNAIIKLFTFKKGALAIFSAIFSGFITLFLNFNASAPVADRGVLSTYLEVLLDGVRIRDMFLLFTVEAGYMFFFMCFTVIDMFTGIQNALYFNSKSSNPLPAARVIESNKLWRTFWKSFGILILTFMLSFMVLFAILSNSETIYWIFLWSLICFWTMACGFEFYSIGENLAKRNNNEKYPIFEFIDRILEAIQRKVVKKIDDSQDFVEEIKGNKENNE